MIIAVIIFVVMKLAVIIFAVKTTFTGFCKIAVILFVGSRHEQPLTPVYRDISCYLTLNLVLTTRTKQANFYYRRQSHWSTIHVRQNDGTGSNIMAQDKTTWHRIKSLGTGRVWDSLWSLPWNYSCAKQFYPMSSHLSCAKNFILCHNFIL